MSSAAWAGPALDDDQKAPATDPNAAQPAPGQVIGPAGPDQDVHYGVDIRLRELFVPKALLQLFVNKAAGGAANFGYGIDVVRRRGDLELAIGVEHEQITVGEGVWVNKGDTVPTNDPDYVLSPADSQDGGLGWTTIDFTFVNHYTFNKYVQLRYGAGAGIGVINGALDHYNVHCGAGATNDNTAPCVPPRFGGPAQYTDPNGNVIQSATQYKYNIPPVFPVIDALIGVQFHPFDKAVISLEGGIHTLPYFGATIGYFFN